MRLKKTTGITTDDTLHITETRVVIREKEGQRECERRMETY
jgi:hypothetical protein